jgi:hypothetical protein
MNDLMILVVIFLMSLVLGLIKFSIYDSKDWSWQHKLAEIWNDFWNFFIAGLIGFYFILVRWPFLSRGEALGTGDFVLFVIFTLGLFGHLCVMSKNITDGIEAILKRVLERK